MHKDSEIIKGKTHYSVTVIISLIRSIGLERWRGKVGNEFADGKMKASAKWGTRVHDFLFAVNRGVMPEKNIVNDIVENYSVYQEKSVDKIIEIETNAINGYTNWFDKYVEEIKFIETDMYSDSYLFKGKPDIIFRFKGGEKFNIADYKTGSFLDKKYIRLQLAGYSILAKENGIDIDGRYYFNLHDGFNEPEKIKKKFHSEDERMFLYQNEIYRYYNL